MASKSKFVGRLNAAAALLLVAGLVAGAPGNVFAQGQPTSVNPTASSVNEQKLLEALKPDTGAPHTINGRVSIPDKRSGNLIQPAGQDWRTFHEGTLHWVGYAAIPGMLALLGLFFAIRGRIRISSGFSGMMVERFGGLDRFAHWLTAISFLVLGFSGLNLTFGKQIVLPFVGPEQFTLLTQAGKIAHNYVSFAFVLGLVLMFLLWVKDNFPHPRDIIWIVKGGGIIGNAHPAAGRFNFGQKLIFWSVILGGAGLSLSGYALMFPFRFPVIGGLQFGDIAGLQLANVVHGLLGVVLVAIIIAHVYIGTLGMQGAFSAMGSGKVDANWAREHHSVWAKKVLGPDESSAKAQPAPAE